MGVSEQLEVIAKKHEKYKVDAYLLIFEGLDRFLSSLPQRRHVKAEELYAGVISVSVAYWGPLANDVVAAFGITSQKDIGDIVEILINEGLLTKNPSDRLEDFYELEGSLDELIKFRFDMELEESPPRICCDS